MLELCAEAGASPTDSLSPKDLYVLAYKRQETEWDHTASILAKVHNMMAKNPIGVDEIHPMRHASKVKKKVGMNIDEFIDQLEAL